MLCTNSDTIRPYLPWHSLSGDTSIGINLVFVFNNVTFEILIRFLSNKLLFSCRHGIAWYLSIVSNSCSCSFFSDPVECKLYSVRLGNG